MEVDQFKEGRLARAGNDARCSIVSGLGPFPSHRCRLMKLGRRRAAGTTGGEADCSIAIAGGFVYLAVILDA
jgi:hypothetical protein